MGITERREMEKETIRKKIFEAASEILIKEGYENLSIRKIAQKIEYSPGTIYHYFKDKTDIIAHILDENTERISKKMYEIPLNMENPENTLTAVLKLFIELVLETPQQYRATVMNDIEAIQQKVSMLDEKKPIKGLYDLLALGIDKGKFKVMDIVLTVQIIWVSTYGLISRLILEKSVSEEQKERLVNHHCEMIKNALLK